jgi:leader peptidase (prepilin peptidase)/N-methyltransferase
MMIYIWLPLVFALGAVVGSFVNVCVYRLPYERSLFWPGSRCGRCFQRIRWYDNLPLLSWWMLRGRCRTCEAPISIRYFFIELFTALGFTGLFYLEIVCNALELPFLKDQQFNLGAGWVPLAAWGVFLHHAVLFSFLLTASLCDLDDMEIPLGLTVTGTLVGLGLATLFAWPFPNDLPAAVDPFRQPPVRLYVRPPPPGLYAWPVWYPLPAWLPQGNWKLGLLTGLAGAAAGMVVLRGVRAVFGWARGLEGLGLGDADLMMMAGAFVGWQPVLMAFFVSAFPALCFGVGPVLRKGDRPLPFGPSLAAGVLLTLFLWPRLGPHFWDLYSQPLLLLLLAGVATVLLLVAGLVLRLTRGAPADTAGAG